MRRMEVAVLEQTLRDHPRDLASWRAYGDWLREQGDVRHELIRLEQQRERTGPYRRQAVQAEIDALVQEHQKSWDAALPPGVTALTRRYGFATRVAVEWSTTRPRRSSGCCASPS